MMNQPFRQAAIAGRHAAEAAKEARQNFRSTTDSVSDTAANKASDIARRETSDELHDRAEEYPHVTLILAVGVGFVL